MLLGVNDDDHIQSGSQRESLIEDQIADLPFEPVADHGPFHAAASPKPNPRNVLAIRQHTDGKLHAFGPSSSSIHGLKGVRALEGDEPGIPRLCQAGMSCQRPFRRRRLSVRLPPRVLIRLRKPCVLFRFRFDLFVRCFFIARASLYVVGGGNPRRNRLSGLAAVL